MFHHWQTSRGWPFTEPIPLPMFYWAVSTWMCFSSPWRDLHFPRLQPAGGQWQEMEQICTVKGHLQYKQVWETQNHHSFNSSLLIKQTFWSSLFSWSSLSTEEKSSALRLRMSHLEIDLCRTDLPCMILPKRSFTVKKRSEFIKMQVLRRAEINVCK